jgi:RNA polymerase sigma-70 factor, ECF subfamily
VPRDASTPGVSLRPPELDADSRAWLDRLASDGAVKAQAVDALFDLLYRAALSEAHRRRGSLPARVVDELDDLARQAADDAVTGVLRKLPDYRGSSRFTTWAYKFAVFELSTALRREAWRERPITMTNEAWDRLSDAIPADPATAAESRDLLAAIRRAIDKQLSPRQRDVLVAVTMLGVPIDAIAERRGSSRGAIYKVLYDARTKLRHALASEGWELDAAGRRG